MKFEAIISSLGDFGPYQKRLYFLVCLIAIPHCFQVLGILFTMGHQNHRCSVPGLTNDTYAVQSDWHRQVLDEWIPTEKDGSYSPCLVFYRDPTTQLPTNETTSCSRHVYDTSIYQTTITSDEDLVCERKSLTTYANMIFMAGMLTGSITMGSLSDSIGRKKTMMGCIVGHLTVSLATAFIQSYVAFVILRFLTAVFSMGMFIIAFVIGVEIVGPKTRKLAGMIIQLFWVIALFINVFLAYLIREWRYLQIATVVPTTLLLSYFFLMPESPRWLIRRGRFEQAAEIIRKAARVNKVAITDEMVNLQTVEKEGPQAKIWQMFTCKVLLVRTLVLVYMWFSCSIVYFGLSLNVAGLSGDVYLNNALYALAEGLSYAACILLLDTVGRKILMSTSMLLAGVSCLATMFPVIYGNEDHSWITITLSMLGKFGSSTTFAVIYIYSAEVFPTTTRNLGIGICSFAARIGGILSPYIADLGNIVEGNTGIALPLVIFGGASLLAGVLALLLPETANRILPETIQEAKDFGRAPVTINSYTLDDDNLEKDTNGSYDLVNVNGDKRKIFINENGHNGNIAAVNKI